MPKPTFAPALGALLALAAAQAMASGFGRMKDATVLGQRLDFSVPLQLDAGQSITPDCVTAEVFAGEFRVAPSAVDVGIVPAGEANARLIRVVTRSAIDEPVVSVTIHVGCASPMTRKFVAFIDPPTIELARADTPGALVPATSRSTTSIASPPQARTEVAIATPATLSAPAVEATPPAAPRSVKHKRSGGASASGAARAASRSVTQSASPKPATLASGKARKTSAAPHVAVAAPAAKGPRLQLDAASPDVMLALTRLRLTDTLPLVLPAAASAPQDAASAAAGAEIAAQRERLVALEASLFKLRAESQATQASLVQLQAQLRESQSQRYANPLVYALMLLCGALAAAVALLWRSRAAERRAAPQWWAPPTSAGAAVATAQAEVAHAGAQPPKGPLAVHPDEWESPDLSSGETTASPRLLEPVASAAPEAESEKEMSVEELIDLEQQAEFFVVLGQDEAAIDLLMGHLRSSGGASPLPYLKLLEIYRRRDDREAYERTRDRFNRRFNAYAPDWDTDLQKGRSLDDYAHVIARLQALWASHGLAMRALETSLFRRDPGASNFDLPAYRELLFLYSIARDLSEHESRANVDVLLPIDGGESASGTLTQLHPTRPMPIAADAYTTQVDVDITCLDAGPAGNDERPSRYLSDFGTTSGDVHVPVQRFAASR